MPIRIPKSLPAFDILQNEGVMVMPHKDADRQDIRPIRIALLNLMPMKIETEIQFARLIGSTPLQIELTLVSMTNYIPKNTPAAHMQSFYKPFANIKNRKFDGFIITGAPIEHLEFLQVEYWEDLKEIFDWTQTNVHSTFAVCWGAMAMLHHFYRLPKYTLKKKAFGCYNHKNISPKNRYLRGFSDKIEIPVSRWSEMRQRDIEEHQSLSILLTSKEVGPCLIQDKKHHALYMFNHLEYDTTTLANEYSRDKESFANASKPVNYFPANKTSKIPANKWRSHGHLLYGNWINEIYQGTPFDVSQIGK
ncbi:MAG: homoserine O-succinyltransferase [Pseudomonadota bacterium]|nr:homoserine O-succinyltransferase [Pseudomonadota bacterium]